MPNYQDTTTSGALGGGFPTIKCKKCGGLGYYDPDKLVEGVPMNMIKDEYWDKV